MKTKFLLLLLIPLYAMSDTLNSGIELGTSVSHYYDSRSVFTNPSALSYQTLLNHARLTSSFEYAFSDGSPNDFAFSLAYGAIGLGVEKLSVLQDPYVRFSVAGGVSIGKRIFIGGRYSFTSSENDSLKSIHSVDLGLQVRATSLLSFGLMFNKLNRPTIGTLQAPIQCIAGVTFLPHRRLMLQADIETSGDRFANHFGYQVGAQYEAFKGVYFTGGYHDEYKYQIGIKLNLKRLSFFATVQPATHEKIAMVGMQTMPLPNHSFAFRPQTLHLVLDHTLSDQGRDGGFFNAGSPSLLEMLEKLRTAAENDSLTSITLEINDFPLGLASAEELSRAVLTTRNSGKKITVVLGNADTKAYLIASAASEIVMDPEGELRILGPRAEHFYGKGTLDKLGISAEFLAKGDYKSFPEMFTRKEASEASKRATLDELKKIEDELLEIFSKNRKISRPTWDEILKKVILTADDAKQLGLVDSIEKRNPTLDKLHKNEEVTQNNKTYRSQLSLPYKVAVITAEGNIMQNRRRSLSLMGEDQVTPQRLEQAFKEASSDPLTRAIVLRIVSPGGEILPSSEIASLVEKTNQEIPVYISMGDVAASGGYMIAAPGRKIFSDKLTYTGSIGVFLGKVSLEGLYKKLDLKKEITGRSPYAGIYSEAKSWNPEERVIMTRLLNNYYSGFVKYVGHKRNLSESQAESAAQGRVWLGRDALKLRLVDALGGLTESIDEAARNYIPDGNYEVWEIRPPETLLASLGFESPFGMEGSLAQSLLGKETLKNFSLLSSLKDEPLLYYSPIMYY